MKGRSKPFNLFLSNGNGSKSALLFCLILKTLSQRRAEPASAAVVPPIIPSVNGSSWKGCTKLTDVVSISVSGSFVSGSCVCSCSVAESAVNENDINSKAATVLM